MESTSITLEKPKPFQHRAMWVGKPKREHLSSKSEGKFLWNFLSEVFELQNEKKNTLLEGKKKCGVKREHSHV